MNGGSDVFRKTSRFWAKVGIDVEEIRTARSKTDTASFI
jgi:hypothetical protein